MDYIYILYIIYGLHICMCMYMCNICNTIADPITHIMYTVSHLDQ